MAQAWNVVLLVAIPLTGVLNMKAVPTKNKRKAREEDITVCNHGRGENKPCFNCFLAHQQQNA